MRNIGEELGLNCISEPCIHQRLPAGKTFSLALFNDVDPRRATIIKVPSTFEFLHTLHNNADTDRFSDLCPRHQVHKPFLRLIFNI